ncbi:Thioesterase lcsJ [Exophiala dermatitidis]
MPLLSMPSIHSLISWRTVAIIFAVVNLKALPLAWHFRLLYRMLANWYSEARIKRTASLAVVGTSPSHRHPLFEPVSIFSHAPLLETDYNLHKSNSTYFSDLDESRTALMTKVLIPGLKQGAKNLERDGHRGRLAVILGSVHTSFHREIAPYERYKVRSRVLGWDRKWIVVASWFIRPAKRGKEEVLLASALSKYVVKKGRFTVPPERCFTTAGWLPPKPAGSEAAKGGASEPSADTTPEGLQESVPEPALTAATELVEKLETATEQVSQSDVTEPREPPTAPVDEEGDWDWHRIEKERLRGLHVAANWLALDQELLEEFLRG